MCGIWGLVTGNSNGFFHNDVNYMEEMAILTSLRGDQSSGIAWGYNTENGQAHLIKAVGDPFHLLRDANDSWDKLSKALIQKGRWILGHGRYATRGNISIKNAHPFREEHITLVHNGTVDELNTKRDETVEVDSHALCIDIAKYGALPTLTKMSGAAAIVWYDAKERALFFFRNGQRDLHYVLTNQRMMFMSEREALEYLLRRNNDYSLVKSILPFDAGILYRLDPKRLELSRVTNVAETKWRAWEEKRKEEEERKQKEAASKPPFFPSLASGPITKANSPGSVRHTTGLEFVITAYEKDPVSKEYCYEGKIKGGDTVVACRTSRPLDEPVIGRKGYVREYRTIYQKGQSRYIFVKFRDVTWDVPDHVQPDSTEDDADDGKLFVVTRNQKRLSIKTWVNLCNDTLCSACRSAVDPESVERSMAFDQGKETYIWCADCTNELEDLGRQTPAEIEQAAKAMMH